MTVFRLEKENADGRTKFRMDAREKCVHVSIIEEAVAVADLTPLEAVMIGKALIRHGEYVLKKAQEAK